MEQNDRQEASPASPKKWVRRTVAVAVAAAIAALAFLAGWLGSWYARDARLRKLAWLIGTLDENYYQDVDLDALYDALYAEVVPDMFSYYYSAPEYEQRISQSEGQNEGVGVSLITQTDGIRLYSVAENSPACLAGLKEGMYLLGWSAVGGEIDVFDEDAVHGRLDFGAGPVRAELHHIGLGIRGHTQCRGDDGKTESEFH